MRRVILAGATAVLICTLLLSGEVALAQDSPPPTVSQPVGEQIAPPGSPPQQQPAPAVGGLQVQRPDITRSSTGGSGSGQLALSMVMTVIVVAILFRTPLPAASTQRWTK